MKLLKKMFFGKSVQKYFLKHLKIISADFRKTFITDGLGI